MRAKKVFFLDRDGTIIEDKIYLNDPEQVFFLPNIFAAMKELQNFGFEFVVVTNQSGVPRGLVQLENLKQIHANIEKAMNQRDVHITSFHYAPYMTDSNHPLRKPNPGMLLEADEQHGPIDFKNSWMVGDKMTDVEAGHRAGTQSILLGEAPQETQYAPPEICAPSLLEAVQALKDKKFL